MENRIKILETLINEYEYAYRVLDNPIVSDEIFDKTKKVLEDLSKQYPHFVSENSPLKKIGSVLVDGFKKVKHDKIMGSIENVYTIDELEEWMYSIAKKLNKPLCNILFDLEDKYDGCSGSIHIKDGNIVRAATRGDGEVGDDITENAKMIWNFDKVLNILGCDFTGEARGEFVIYKDSFDKICLNESTTFKNPRNLVAGTMKSLDSNVVRNRYVHFELFDAFDKNGKQLKLNLTHYGKELAIDKICQYQKQKLYKQKSYMVDGMVIKVSDIADREKLGYGGSCPVWARAFKYEQEKAITRVLSITWQVGRDRITPVAELEPVDLEGSTISRATIHNVTQLKRLGVVPGCMVEIEKAGYIIPYINKVVENKIVANVEIPKTCPICFGKTEIRKIESEYLICTNDQCKGKLSSQLEYFVKTLKIDNIGSGIVDKLVQSGLVKTPIDIFSLTVADLVKLDKMGKANAGKIYNNIQKGLIQPLNKVIASLGIGEVGDSNSEKIGMKIKSFSDFINCSEFVLTSIENIGEKTVQSIMAYISKNRDYLNKVEKTFIIKKDENISNILEGMNIVITGGAVKGRDELESMVKKNGGECSGSVSKKTSYLIIGSKEDSSFNSSKKKKALDLNIPIVNEFWLFEKINFTVEENSVSIVAKDNNLNDYF